MQNINLAKGTDHTKRIVNDHRWTFIESFQTATPITTAVRAQGGHVALELPGGNAYWNETPIQTWMNEFKIQTYRSMVACMDFWPSLAHMLEHVCSKPG